MERKAKWNFGAPLIIGIVFGVIGVLFLSVGLGLFFYSADSDAKIVSFVFMPMGAFFLSMGIVFLSVVLSQKRQADRLIAAGRYVWGRVAEFVPNYSIRVNNRHPYIAIVRYEDSSGIHVFRSRNLYHYPDMSAVGRQVKIYIKDGSFKPYYVDIDPILPRVFEH